MIQSMNFTQAHLKEVTPTKEQATVLDKVEGTPIQAYVIAIADKIALENILSTSRIANNRIFPVSRPTKFEFLTTSGSSSVTGEKFWTNEKVFSSIKDVKAGAFIIHGNDDNDDDDDNGDDDLAGNSNDNDNTRDEGESDVTSDDDINKTDDDENHDKEDNDDDDDVDADDSDDDDNDDNDNYDSVDVSDCDSNYDRDLDEDSVKVWTADC
ncbi:uncharacterized protein LOC103575580 [Microplitis demolitor]|uniref:uncharacterized protein LOC103575580 n=1 Tax=Microplitis demolitor TaxID=69319 RepID=UPI0006D5197F|nr:uncharacterized protein LOC103575580 [Microplitis demolitor]